jgi:VanZ family protein
MWRAWPESRGDFIANVAFYFPCGFAIVACFSSRLPMILRLTLTVILGSAISITMELGQFYIAERVDDIRDTYANALGTLLGAIAATTFISALRLPLLDIARRAPFPSLLVAAFIAGRLYPYVPVIDLHKYWHAVRPLLSFAVPGGDEIFLRMMAWTAVRVLLERVVGCGRAPAAYLALAVLVFFGQILGAGGELRWGEVLGAVLGVFAWMALRRLHRSALSVALLFTIALIIERLQPFDFSPVAHPFGWVTFHALFAGTNEHSLVTMAEKFFLYGATIWLWVEAGLSQQTATIVTSIVLLICSVVEIYLPTRSAEITDGIMALAIGSLMVLLSASRKEPMTSTALQK